MRYIPTVYVPDYKSPKGLRYYLGIALSVVIIAIVIGLVIWQDLNNSNDSKQAEVSSDGYTGGVDDLAYVGGVSPDDGPETNDSDNASQVYAPGTIVGVRETATDAETIQGNHTNPNYASLPACVVTRVSDGDTLYVNCLSERIRLVGVDTPESTNEVDCYGYESSNKTKSLLGQTVYLEVDPSSGEADMYGRPLRYVYLADGTNYNMQLIEEGYGTLYVFSGQDFTYRELFEQAELRARQSGVGLWSACSVAKNRYGNYEVTN